MNSLDRGLRLLQILRDYGSLGVAEAAQHLGVSRSSAHRLLQTLVYRGFASQDDNRLYQPGEAMDAAPARLAWTKDVLQVCQPHLAVLARRAQESVNLMIRVGPNVRFLTTVRADTHAGTNLRDGIVMLAHRTSGGKALLAELSDDELEDLYSAATRTRHALTDDVMSKLRTDLHHARRTGFAVNVEETERGVAAVGVALHDHRGVAIGALTLSTAARQFGARLHSALLPLLLDTRREVEHDLALAHPETQADGPHTSPKPENTRNADRSDLGDARVHTSRNVTCEHRVELPE